LKPRYRQRDMWQLEVNCAERKVVWSQTTFGRSAIVCLREVTTRGHIWRGLRREELVPEFREYNNVKEEVAGAIEPVPED
jgi:hypothetical protein